MKNEYFEYKKTYIMGTGYSTIKCKGITVLHPCDERFRGYLIDETQTSSISRDYINGDANISYGNYHLHDKEFYLSKNVIM